MLERVQGAGGEDPGLAHRRRRRACGGARLADRLAEPASAEPTGAPRPLEKQIETVSKCWAHSRAGLPVATTAFISRAPSRCMARLCPRAQRRIAAMLSIGWTRPPPRLCVFSRQTRRVRT